MTLQEAIDFLADLNADIYDSSTNPGGLDGVGGMDANLVEAFNAIATLGQSLMQLAGYAAAYSSTNRTIGAGSHTFTPDTTVTVLAGLYLICPPDELGNPVNFMLGRLAADAIDASSLTFEVPAGAVGGSGAHSSWAIAPIPVRIGGFRNVAGSDTHAVTDRDGTIRYTGSGSHTETLVAAATAGAGFHTTFRNSGSTNWTLDGNSAETIDGSATITLEPGWTVTLRSNGTAWESISAVGYGAPEVPEPSDSLFRYFMYR
jgi:hypothetical protein